MPSRFRPRLVNGPFGDPGLFIPLQFDRRALIFDLGDLGPLPARDLLKISHAFVTHTHMDHFVGFDPLLRCLLGREKDVALFGPAGFLRNVEGKLAAYTWDLVDRQSCPLRLHVTEVRPGTLLRRSFVCAEGFAAQGDPLPLPFAGTLLAEPAFRVDAAVLAHSTDCLGLAITERFHVNILTPGLAALGLAPGPWLNRFKTAIFEGRDPESDFEVGTAGGPAGGCCVWGSSRERSPGSRREERSPTSRTSATRPPTGRPSRDSRPTRTCCSSRLPSWTPTATAPQPDTT